MSITLSDMRGILNNRIGDVVVSGTTTSAGNAAGTTVLDTALAKYPDDYFGEKQTSFWILYLTATSQAKAVESFTSPEGILKVCSAFTSQVAISTAYELHRYDPAVKKIVLNQALRDVYPYFYKRLYDTTLWGQNNYGQDPDEFNKFIYTVPSTFEEFPIQIWLLESYIGTHTGDDAAAVLTDSDADWPVNGLIGFTVYNKTDESSGTITANTATTITATLSDDGEWDEDDEYIVQKPNKKPVRFYTYTIIDPANIGSFKFYADINERYLIVLVGRAQLTQFTNDASTTELTNDQAEVVCLKAASNFYRAFSTLINAQDSSRADSLASRFEDDFKEEVKTKRMPSVCRAMRVDFSWLE